MIPEDNNFSEPISQKSSEDNEKAGDNIKNREGELNSNHIENNNTKTDTGKEPEDEELFANKVFNLNGNEIRKLLIKGDAIFYTPNKSESEILFNNDYKLDSHFQLPQELSTKINLYRETLLEQHVLIINCLDEELSETVCAKLLNESSFSSALLKALYQCEWGAEAPNAIGPLLKLLENEDHSSKKPTILFYYEEASNVNTSLFVSLTGQEKAREGNTKKLKSINTYLIYILQSPRETDNLGKIKTKVPPFLWSLDFYPHLLFKYAEGSLIHSMREYFDWLLTKSEELRANEYAFYGILNETLKQKHPESFYMNRERITIQTEKFSSDELDSILVNQLYFAVIYIQCYLPSIPLREYDPVLLILLPNFPETTQPSYLHPLAAWKNNPDEVLNNCKLIAHHSEDGSRKLEFRSGSLQVQFRELLEKKYVMGIEKLTQYLRNSLLLFTSVHSSELQTGLIHLFKDAMIRQEKSARVHELLHWFKTWDTALRDQDPRGIALHSKMLARLLAELMILEDFMPIVNDLFSRMAQDSTAHFLLLEILFTLTRWFDLPNYSWMRKMVNSENLTISKKAIRLIHHTIRGNNVSLAQTILTYCSWLPATLTESYNSSEQFALSLFTELLDDTEINSTQWGFWPPRVSVFTECADNYKETIAAICKVILHPGVIQELETHFRVNLSQGQQAVRQANALYSLGFNHPSGRDLGNPDEKRKWPMIAAEILYTWKISELLVYWCMILQGPSSSRMHPKARHVRENLLEEVAKHSSLSLRQYLLTALAVAEKTNYDKIITALQVRDVRMQFQYIIQKLPNKK